MMARVASDVVYFPDSRDVDLARYSICLRKDHSKCEMLSTVCLLAGSRHDVLVLHTGR